MLHRKRRLGYLEVVEKILKACPGVKTTIYSRSGLTFYTFNSPRYLPLVLKEGLARIAEDHEREYSVYLGANIYLLTPKGERYLKLMKEAKELLGL